MSKHEVMEKAADAVISAVTSVPADSEIDEADVLVAEIADTTIINNVMDDFINVTEAALFELQDVSLQGNPVMTHVNIVGATDAIIEALYNLKQTLLDTLAKHGDEFDEKGGTLRTQVVDEEK